MNMKMKPSFSAPLFVSILYVLVLGTDFFREKLTGAGGNEYLSVIIVQLLIFIIPAILFCRLNGVGYASRLNVRLVPPNRFGSIITASLVLVFGSMLIRFAQIYLFGMNSFTVSGFESYISGRTEYNFLFAAAAFAIIPALTDEFVFRSILLTEYNEGGYGAINATVISSLLSSMLFFTLESIPIRFFSAIVLLFLFLFDREKTVASLRPAVKPRPLLWSALVGVAAHTGNFLHLLAASTLPASVQFPIVSGGVIVLSALASILIFREKMSRVDALLVAGVFLATFLFAF